MTATPWHNSMKDVRGILTILAQNAQYDFPETGFIEEMLGPDYDPRSPDMPLFIDDLLRDYPGLEAMAATFDETGVWL